jgi:hypothetical protein
MSADVDGLLMHVSRAWPNRHLPASSLLVQLLKLLQLLRAAAAAGACGLLLAIKDRQQCQHARNRKQWPIC